jgi:single-strand DNA-binding protein
MADLNEVRLIGRLTRDPELRSTPSGMAVCSLGLATGRKYRGQDGVLKDETTFVDITCWAKTAENVVKYLKKGKQIFVAGRLRYETWEDKQTHQKRSKLSVVAENVQFLDRREESNNPPEMEVSAPDQGANAQPGQPGQPPSWDNPDLGEPPF